jgi:uncharacterized protein involved in cysteine biosynthesis
MAQVMMTAITLAFRQLGHPATLRLVLLVALITLLIFAVFGALGGWVASRWILPALPDDGSDRLIALLLLVLYALSAFFLFRSVAVAVMGLFTDGIVASVEEEHYPEAAARARHVSFATGLRLGLASLGRALGWNLLALPFYLGLIVTGIGPFLLMWLVNAALLAHDCEAMAAARHPDGPRRPLDRRSRWVLGLSTSAMFLIPLANLFAPLFGAALAVHLLHQPSRSAKPEYRP